MQFEMWSPFHYAMIVFPFLLAVVLHYSVRNRSFAVRRNMGLTLSVVMIIILMVRNTYIWINEGALNPEIFPFQVCHFASFVYLLAVLSRDKLWGTMGWCLNFPAGLVSVVFADGLMNYETLVHTQAITYILGHMLIVTTGLYLLTAGFVSINWQSMKRMYFWTGTGYVLSVFINNLFNYLFARTGVDSNYFYSFKPEAGTPLEAMFNLGSSYTVAGITFNPVYLLLLAVVGACVLGVMYGVFVAAKKLSSGISRPA